MKVKRVFVVFVWHCSYLNTLRAKYHIKLRINFVYDFFHLTYLKGNKAIRC